VKGPTVLQGVIDSLESPSPAKVTADQALDFAESLARRSQSNKIALAALSDKVREPI
jgi:hypothetical protein